MRLADGEAADRVAGEINFEELPRTFAAKIGERGALHDAELPLREFAVLLCALVKIIPRAAGPRGGAPQGGCGDFARRWCLDAFVEHHGDVRTERELNLCGFFRREQMLGAIQMRAKAHAVVADFAQLGKAENLVAAGIGENRAVPGHEFVQAAQFANQFVAGTKIEMIGIAENHLRAEFFERFIAQALHGGLRAHRHEHRRFDRAMRSAQAAAARATRVGHCNGKAEFHSLECIRRKSTLCPS